MRIATDRLVLREFVINDWRDVLAYQRDPRFLQFYTWTDRTEAEVRAEVQTFVDQQAERPRREFVSAITFPSGGQVIGNCEIHRKHDNDLDAESGFELVPEHWGRGYATEAALAMVSFGFRELGLHRISAWCIAENAASVRELEKVGLRPEGRLRENRYFKGRWWDTLLYGLLKGEWRASATNR